jgi:hypothetical protein
MNYEEDFELESRIIEYGYYKFESEIDQILGIKSKSISKSIKNISSKI